MAGDRTNSGDPIAELPELSGQLRPPAPIMEPQTLAGRLVPVADKLRNLYAMFGLAIYRVFMVHVAWSGKKKGVGTPTIISRREILPIPRVRDLAAVRRIPRATGLTEEGDIIIDRISGKYTEDDLTGATPDLTDPNLSRTSLKAIDFFYEIQENRPSTPPPPLRRYSAPVGIPMLSRGGFAWTITLTKQNNDRSRRGDMLDPTAE